MRKTLGRYGIAVLLIFINIIIVLIFPEVGVKSIDMTKKNIIEMLSVIPPIFILLGLLDVWVKRETMIKLMGKNSGIKGVAIAFMLGSVAAGPLYAAFPVAGILLKKGSNLSNVIIFIGAWSTTKIPLLLFEASSMGFKFMITRFIINLFGIAAIAIVTERLLSNDEKSAIFQKAASF